MRKTTQEIKGYVIFDEKTDDERCIKIEDLGNYLMPNFNGMLKANLINNRMFIIDLQQHGIKFEKTFHYKTREEKDRIILEQIKTFHQQMESYLKEFYHLDNFNILLKTKELFDEDYCTLPIEVAKKDLTQEEFKEVLMELQHYQPTVKTNMKKTGQSVYF